MLSKHRLLPWLILLVVGSLAFTEGNIGRFRSLTSSRIEQVRYATNYQWQQTPTSPVSISVGSNVVTINGVAGVSAYSVSKVQHYLWLAGSGTPERVKITATTCTGSETGICTVTFTAAAMHSPGYTLGTATAGWQEAWVDAFPVNLTNPMQASKIVGSPDNDNANAYLFNAPLDIDMQRGNQPPIVLDGQGSTILCNTSGLSCIEVGTGTAGKLGFQPTATVIENFQFVPATGFVRTRNGSSRVIHDHGQGLEIRHVAFSAKTAGEVFDDLVVVDDDQSFKWYSNYLNTGGGPPLACDLTYCGVALRGKSFSVGSVMSTDFQMSCKGNAIDWANNELGIYGGVIQGYMQYGIRFKAPFPNFGVTIDNSHFEIGRCTNPIGTGQAGVIVQNGFANIRGGTGPAGKLPSFTASSTGSTQFSYWVVTKSSTLGTSAPALAGYCLSDGTGTCKLRWNQIGTAGTITYDVIRIQSKLTNENAAPYTALCTGGSVPACGSVATAVTTASCKATGAGNYCEISDDVTAPSIPYTVNLPTYFPGVSLWPGNVVLAVGSDGNNLSNGSAPKVYMDTFIPASNTGGIVSFGGRHSISAVVNYCGVQAAGTVGYMNCLSGNAAAGTQPAMVLLTGAVPTSSRKGLLLFEHDPKTTYISSDMITLGDTNPGKTSATPGNRPTSDATDTAIGFDATATLNSQILGFRAPGGHRWYVGSMFDNSSWILQLSSTTLTSKVPLRTTPVPFSSLPSCAAGTEGSTASVTDSSTDTWGTTISGGSTNHVLAYCNGTAWTVVAK
jgi:hypothetical protein